MNRNGQTLVAFVIIVPVFILILAFVVDTGLILKEATRLNSVTKTILRTTYNERNRSDYKERVINLFEKNDVSVEKLEIVITSDEIKISNHCHVESIFGKIIGLKEYEIKLTLLAQEVNGELIIKKE